MDLSALNREISNVSIFLIWSAVARHRFVFMNDTFSANSLRLTPTQWLIALAIVLVAVILLPIWADNAEPFTPAESYRLPFATSEDYWTYHRLTKWTQQKNRALVIGDSVIWGEYVTPSQTLTHYLGPQYVNGGLPGAYPLALEGLVRHYCDVRKSKVILHLNLLWLSSKERDLQIKGTPFNHPRLLAQFDSPPAYEASISEQLGVTVDRHLPIRRWGHHLRITRFEGHDIHTWSMEHPYRNPLRVEPVALSDKARHDDRSWKQRGIERQDISWLTLDSQQ